jgi:hypothetical protein
MTAADGSFCQKTSTSLINTVGFQPNGMGVLRSDKINTIDSSGSIRKIETFSQVNGKEGSISGRTPELGVRCLDFNIQTFAGPEPAGWHS